jgi:hypothetical protein
MIEVDEPFPGLLSFRAAGNGLFAFLPLQIRTDELEEQNQKDDQYRDQYDDEIHPVHNPITP